jgi:hypothetical protein
MAMRSRKAELEKMLAFFLDEVEEMKSTDVYWDVLDAGVKKQIAALRTELATGDAYGCALAAIDVAEEYRAAVQQNMREELAAITRDTKKLDQILNARSDKKRRDKWEQYKRINAYIDGRIKERGTAKKPSRTEIRRDAESEFDVSKDTVLRAQKSHDELADGAAMRESNTAFRIAMLDLDIKAKKR